MLARKPKSRVYRRLDPNFASDYIKTLRLLSRKHKIDDAEEVKSILRLLKNMSDDSFYAGRGKVWIPTPSPRTGYYPIIEKVPYTTVRRAIRSNTSEAVRARAWGVVASSVEPFVPLFARRPGSLTEAQRRSLLAHAMVALPFVKGRHPALLGKRVPGELGVSDIGTRSIIPVRRMAPEDWEKGFTMRKFSLEDTLKRRRSARARRIMRDEHTIAHWRDSLGPKGASMAKKLIKQHKHAHVKGLAIGTALASLAAWKLASVIRHPEVPRFAGIRPLPKKKKTSYSLSEDLSKAIKRKLTAKPRVPNPTLRSPKPDLKDVLKRATDTKVKLEPERHDYAGELAVRGGYPRTRKATRVKVRLKGPHARQTTAARWMGRHSKKLHAGAFMTGFGGATAVGALIAAKRKRKQQQYTLSDIDRMCYDDGVREWLKRAKHKTARVWKGAVKWVKGEVLPTVARNVTLGMAGLAHTELGIPPTTVDLLPVQRVGLKRDLQPYPSMQLRKVVEGLQQRLVSEVDPVLRKGLEKGVSEIATELMVRKSMPGFI